MKLLSLLPGHRTKTVVFIFGCQRSGTTMLEKVFARHPAISVYGEGNRAAMKTEEHYRFRETETIRRIVSRDRKRFVVFKPINDSQHADHQLNGHPGSKVIWIYRHYSDTINSLIQKWGPTQKEIVHRIVRTGETDISTPDAQSRSHDIYTERMHPDTLSTFRRLAGQGITDEEGAALVWYARNQIYFDLDLAHDSRVLMVNYEDLVTHPRSRLEEVFDFVGCPLGDNSAEEVTASSIGRYPAPALRPEIAALCQHMMQRLDRAYTAQHHVST